jgi:hypothetical protein
MSGGKDEQGRDARDRERSREAHWRVAEAGAAGEERPSEDRRRPQTEEDDQEAQESDPAETADDRQPD